MTPRSPQSNRAHNFRIVGTVRNEAESLNLDWRPLESKLLAAAGERELAEEFLFVNDEWQERNQIMARHIREVACKFAGKRLVVLAGAEHRHILRELLAKAPEVELKEFYEVPEWTGATPPTFASAIVAAS